MLGNGRREEEKERKSKLYFWGNSALCKELGIIGERGQLRENREQNEKENEKGKKRV